VLSLPPAASQTDDTCQYWLTPVASDKDGAAEDVIKTLVGTEQIYAFGDKTPGRKHLKPGDWICFYASGKGIIAHARVSSAPHRTPHHKVRHADRYPWTFRLDQAQLYLTKPVVVGADARANLDAFAERDQQKAGPGLCRERTD
jgi:hypothetical protein